MSGTVGTQSYEFAAPLPVENVQASLQSERPAMQYVRQVAEPQERKLLFEDQSSHPQVTQQAFFVATNASAEKELPSQHHSCMPKCMYQCKTAVCDQQCTPQCSSPKCQTRCYGTDLSACRMECGKPHCSVVCPQRACSGTGCPVCTTHCSEPMCMLQCPKAQPCRNVCEEPKCSWTCRAPKSCPKPTCEMLCESPTQCMGSTYRQLPPLQPGEIAVQSFSAPAGLNLSTIAQNTASDSFSSLQFDQVPHSQRSVPSAWRQVQGGFSPALRVPVQGAVGPMASPQWLPDYSAPVDEGMTRIPAAMSFNQFYSSATPRELD